MHKPLPQPPNSTGVIRYSPDYSLPLQILYATQIDTFIDLIASWTRECGLSYAFISSTIKLSMSLYIYKRRWIVSQELYNRNVSEQRFVIWQDWRTVRPRSSFEEPRQQNSIDTLMKNRWI